MFLVTFVKKWGVKIVRPRYEPATGEFLGLYKAIGFIVVKGDDNGHFLNYGYNENKSKLLYSLHKRRVPNNFGGTMFTRHILMVESGELDTEFSRFYSFLPCITDSREEVNQYMKCVNIHPFNLDEREFGDGFQPKIMTDYVVSVLKKLLKYQI